MTLKTPLTGLSEFGVVRHAWPRPNKRSTLKSFLSLVTISSIKIKYSDWFLLDIITIKEFYHLLGRKQISYITWEETIFDSVTKLIFHFELFLIWPYNPNQQKTPLASLSKFGMSGHVWLHPTKYGSFECYLLLVTISMRNVYVTNWFLPDKLMINRSSNLMWQEHFGPKHLKQNFPRYGIYTGKKNFKALYFRLLPAKSINKILQGPYKTLCWAYFGPMKYTQKCIVPSISILKIVNKYTEKLS